MNHYNQALRQQAKTLKAQYEGLSSEYRHLFDHTRKIRPSDVTLAMDLEIRHLDRLTKDVADEVACIQDPARLVDMLDLWRR